MRIQGILSIRFSLTVTRFSISATLTPLMNRPPRHLSYSHAAKIFFACVLCMVCAISSGCAGTGGATGESLFAPTQISEIYSQVSLRVKLAFTPSERKDHFENPERECAGPTEFEERVARIGARLAVSAYRAHPGLVERIPRFVFAISDKLEPGVASTAGGLIVVLRPVSDISLSVDALAFIIAREMGHVISRHHEQNTAVSIAISVAATVLAPALNIAKLLAFATTSSGTAAAVTQVTSSAASFAGSQAVIASYGDRQRRVADGVALRIMPLAGYDARAVPAGLTPECPHTEPTKWLRELQESVAQLAPIRSTNGANGANGASGIILEANAAASVVPLSAPVEERGTPAN